MTNPYQPPASSMPRLDADLTEGPAVAHYVLTKNGVKYAMAKFMLHHCIARISWLSISMIALALFALVDWPISLGGVPGPIRILSVMLLTAVAYRGMIAGPERRATAQLVKHGLVPDARITVTIRTNTIEWQSSPPGGETIEFRRAVNRRCEMRTGKGILFLVQNQLFVFVPRNADFEGLTYRQFRRKLRLLLQATDP